MRTLPKLTRAIPPLFGACAAIGLILLGCSVAAGQGSTTEPPPLVLAEYQVWHGLPCHQQPPPPYDSRDPGTIARHINAAKARGIDGFVIDWYGPKAGVANDAEREFMDQATAEVMRQSPAQGFNAGLMYDEGTLKQSGVPTSTYTALMIADLLYASQQYFTSTAYLRLNGHPALFIFPYADVDAYIDWPRVKSALPAELSIIFLGPNLDSQSHPKENDTLFDGFYAWVQPGHYPWSADGTDWGEDYLRWFYETMKGTFPYSDKIMVGGVWPGFDDSEACWGSNRYMWPRCGQTWRDTWALANQYHASVVMIDTWNDFDEDTAVEYGTGDCLVPASLQVALPGRTALYTHTVINTGKYADIFHLAATSQHQWPTTQSLTEVTLGRHASATLAVSLTVPSSAVIGIHDQLVVTATSSLSPTVQSQVDDLLIVGQGLYLPLLLRR